jgi:drug/metabolite transporter (DMT)-like permease
MNRLISNSIKSLRSESNRWLGFFYVLIAGIGFGFLGIFGKLAFRNHLQVYELLTFRFLIAGLLIGLGLLVFRRQDLKLSLRQIVTSIILGVLGYATFSSLYFMSIQGLSVAIAAMLLFCFPLFVILGEVIFFREKISKQKILSLFMCLLGIALLIYSPNSSSVGNSVYSFIALNKVKYFIYALAAALTYSVYVLVSGRLQKVTPAGGSSFYVILSAGIALLIFNFSHIQFEKLLIIDNFMIVMGIAVVCTILPITAFLLGLQRLPSGTASIIVTVEPVVATIAGFLILGESLLPSQIIGGGLVLAGIIFIQIKS